MVDAAGALRLVEASDVRADERVGLPPAYKDEACGRLNANPAVVNSRMRTISRSTRQLGQWFMLSRLALAPGEWPGLSSGGLRGVECIF